MKPDRDLRSIMAVAIIAITVSFMRDREYFRLPAEALENIDAERETNGVLADPDLMRQLALSEDDVREGRTSSLDDVKRDLGLLG